MPVWILLLRDIHARFGSWKVILCNYSPVEAVNRPMDVVSGQLWALPKIPCCPQQNHPFQLVKQLKSSRTACLHLLYFCTSSEPAWHLLLRVFQWLYKPLITCIQSLTAWNTWSGLCFSDYIWLTQEIMGEGVHIKDERLCILESYF